MFRVKKRIVVAALSIVSLVACSSAPVEDPTDAPSNFSGECAAFAQYGSLRGRSVNVYTPIVSPEDQSHIDSFKLFEECTGVRINYEGSREFETRLPGKIDADAPPDIAYFPQPGLLRSLIARFPGRVKEVQGQALANLEANYQKVWKDHASVDGKVYAVPVGASVKSFVWYSPRAFTENGYQIPRTLEELTTLTQKIAEDHRVVTALDQAGNILKNGAYVNGGLGNAKSIATTSFTAAGLPILDGSCFLHRQASFYQVNWPTDKKIAEDGDVFAFRLPGTTETDPPLLMGGEFAAAFSDREEVRAFQAYLTSPEFSNAKAKVTGPGWISANNKLDPSILSSPVDRLSYELITSDNSVLRFDASDQMPGSVGTGSFWVGMTDWVSLEKSSQDVLTEIENSWPKS